jgi:hypothetical protein
MAENEEKELVFTVSQPQAGILRFQLSDRAGAELASEDLPHTGHVDNLLLTGVDNLLKRSKLHKSALRLVVLGQGIDKNSSLYRIVQSFAAAVTAS